MNDHPERPANAAALVELAQLDLRYEGCRLKSPAAEDRLLAGIAQVGIQEPLQGVEVGGVRILLNGFKRLRCAQKLHLATVPFVALATDETAGIVCLLRAANEHALSLLEQARFLDELKGVGGLSVAEIAQQVGRSPAWVSLRLGVLAELSPRVRSALFDGAFPVYSYLYTLRPFRRLLLIRLFQQATSGSVGEWLDRRFRKLCVSFSCNSPARKLAKNISPPAVGRMASCVRAVEGGALMNWRSSGVGNVPVVGTRFR